MEVRKNIEYFDKEKTQIMWREVTIIFDDNDRINLREMHDQIGFIPKVVVANGNYFTYDGVLLQKSGRGRMRKADLEKIAEIERQAKTIMKELEF